jgi:hypothetical protein
MSEPNTYASWTLNAAVAAILTIVTWVFFYFETPDARLDTRDTTVVFGAWFLVTMLARLSWQRATRKKG